MQRASRAFLAGGGVETREGRRASRGEAQNTQQQQIESRRPLRGVFRGLSYQRPE